VLRGTGIDGRRDGIVIGNLLASFMHQRDVAVSRWVDCFVTFVRTRKSSTMKNVGQAEET
jgi:cobyrinic acid a,c-diamide synthase